MEFAQGYLEAKERYPAVRSEHWAVATAWAFDMLRLTECAEVAKPGWWNDEGLKALSARVVRNTESAIDIFRLFMRACLLCGMSLLTLEAVPRSAAEFKEAAAH